MLKEVDDNSEKALICPDDENEDSDNSFDLHEASDIETDWSDTLIWAEFKHLVSLFSFHCHFEDYT